MKITLEEVCASHYGYWITDSGEIIDVEGRHENHTVNGMYSETFDAGWIRVVNLSDAFLKKTRYGVEGRTSKITLPALETVSKLVKKLSADTVLVEVLITEKRRNLISEEVPAKNVYSVMRPHVAETATV